MSADAIRLAKRMGHPSGKGFLPTYFSAVNELREVRAADPCGPIPYHPYLRAMGFFGTGRYKGSKRNVRQAYRLYRSFLTELSRLAAKRAKACPSAGPLPPLPIIDGYGSYHGSGDELGPYDPTGLSASLPTSAGASTSVGGVCSYTTFAQAKLAYRRYYALAQQALSAGQITKAKAYTRHWKCARNEMIRLGTSPYGFIGTSMLAYKKMVPQNPQLSVEQDPPRLCLDLKSEHALQNQRKFAFLVGGPAVFLAGKQLKGFFGTFVMGLGVACTAWHYTSYKKVSEITGIK